MRAWLLGPAVIPRSRRVGVDGSGWAPGVFTRPLCFPGEQEQRMDLSHPVHADNCVLDPVTGECWREPPAYTYRDYRWAPPTPRGQAGGPGLGVSLPAVSFPFQWAPLPQ